MLFEHHMINTTDTPHKRSIMLLHYDIFIDIFIVHSFYDEKYEKFIKIEIFDKLYHLLIWIYLPRYYFFKKNMIRTNLFVFHI